MYEDVDEELEQKEDVEQRAVEHHHPVSKKFTVLGGLDHKDSAYVANDDGHNSSRM